MSRSKLAILAPALVLLLLPVCAYAGGTPLPVPEPQTIGIFGLAIGALAYLKFRRRK